MTKDGSFKKVVRRHATETGQRYTEALTDLEGVALRGQHEPVGDQLLAHVRDRHGVDATAATKVSVHNNHVFRIDRNDGEPWIARAFPPDRPKEGVEGDAAILRFLERQTYPAERLAVDDAVSDFAGSGVIVTRPIDGALLPAGSEKMRMMGALLGSLHALTPDESVSRPGGAAGSDPTREGSPRQDLMASLALLDSIDVKVSTEHRERFEQLRDQVRSADYGDGLPEALLHGNLVHAPDHALVTGDGPVAFNWKAAGIGPRMADLAFLLTCTWGDVASINAAVDGYRRHIEVSDDELDRLEGVMCIRPLFLVCFDYHRAVLTRYQPSGEEGWCGFIDPDNIRGIAEAARAAFRR